MKRWLSIVMILFIAVTLVVPVLGAEATEVLPESYDAPTIKNMMDYIVQTGNTDEQVFHLIANAYLVDPGMVAQLMCDYADVEINFLAKAIAYDLYQTGRTRKASIPDVEDASVNAVATTVFQQCRNSANSSLDVFTAETESMANVMLLDNGVSENYFLRISIPTDVTPSVAAPLDVEVTVGSYTTSSVDRMVRFTVYKTFDGSQTVAATGRVTIPANKVGGTTTVSVMFAEAGDYQIQVQMMSFGDTAYSSPSYSVSVNGNWKITVELTADRTQFGLITLYDASGAEVSHAKCLGLSAKNLPMHEVDGHTPIGTYSGTLGAVRVETEKYGPYQVVELTPQSGYIVDACSHRWGIMIHGGRPSYYAGLTEDDPGFALCPTNGCVRVTNSYQLQLQNEITALVANNHYARGIVIITQDGQTNL